MTSAHENSLEYVPITGRGVTALDNRKEHNNNSPVEVASLRASIDKVKERNFKSLLNLAAAAKKLARG